MTIREKLYALLDSRPEGAAESELIGIVFSGGTPDPELSGKVLNQLLGHDPAFSYDPDQRRWALGHGQSLRVDCGAASYVVVDLETTGGSPETDGIIEIGACRLEGGRIVDRFQSLVRPPTRIPRFISGLTAITNQMVAAAPAIEEVLPAFKSFLGDSVLVAHNAQFDAGFLDHQFRRHFQLGLRNPILCTLRLARRLLPSMRRRGLDALAEHFGLSTEGRHRGLGDARMAAELLAIFLEMAAQMGIRRLDLLLEYQHAGATGQRIERHVPAEVVAALPTGPGVYLMRNERGDLLYVGKAANLKRRVASYFNGGVGRKRKVIELINHVWAVETRPARSSLEAALIEARLIRELKPPYNRMLKSSPAAHFVRVDWTDPFPKLMLVSRLRAKPGLLQLGPFIGRANPQNGVAALARLLRLRVCSGRLNPAPDVSPCIYGQMGRCSAPCNRSVDEVGYEAQLRRAIDFLRGRTAPLLTELTRARSMAAQAMRFEEAQRHQRDLDTLSLLAVRERRLSRVVEENNLVIIERRGNQATPSPPALVTVVLSGRLAWQGDLTGPETAHEVAAVVGRDYERYRNRPVAREELEAMLIVARWLRERRADEADLIFLTSPLLSPLALLPFGAPEPVQVQEA